MKIKAVYIIELEAPNLDSVDEIVHGVWEQGETEDHNTCLVQDDVAEVERFSWEPPLRGERS